MPCGKWSDEKRAYVNAQDVTAEATPVKTAESVALPVRESDMSMPDDQPIDLSFVPKQCDCNWCVNFREKEKMKRKTADLPNRFIDRLTSEQRKQFPMATGLLDYFPDALAAVSHVSWNGNEKHNPGQPLHHARGKSMDHPDCVVRHMSTRAEKDPAYRDDVCAEVYHLAQESWRSLALLQEAMERIYNLPLPPGAKQ